MTTGIKLKGLTFSGPSAKSAKLNFGQGLSILYGASNTGKSFTLKVLDFMLGASRELPNVAERREYDRVWLALSLPKDGSVSFMRPVAGGAMQLYAGDVSEQATDGKNGRSLSARHDSSNPDNLSQLLLNELEFGSPNIAIDANGKKRSLSFRDLARYCLVDETSIQSEESPVESGMHPTRTAERSVFKLLLTGMDDSALVPVVDRKTFKASTAGKLEVLDEMIEAIGEELKADFPNSDQLSDQFTRLEETWLQSQREMQLAHESIRGRIAEKANLAIAITQNEARRAEIHINLGRFEQLTDVYQSDITRLEAIEEVGFLLALGGDKDCPLCGASPRDQLHSHSLTEIENARDAAGAEIEKIKKQSVELELTIAQLVNESLAVEEQLEKFELRLTQIEADIAQAAPAVDTIRQKFEETFAIRDHVRKGLALLEQRKLLQTRRDEFAKLKPATKSERPKLVAPSTATHDFAQKVSEVLTAWQFPGKRHVSFDESTHDLIIDGKNRKDNGKGVRAITHAAFKVALLLYCKERELPHPGFIVLDTPLLTYRDPLHSRAGALSPDEAAISNTSLKDFFFEHLAANEAAGQFLVIENVDLPNEIEKYATIETFTGDALNGRAGLF